MDVERLPSGKFATTAVVLSGAMLAYNMLRWLGHNELTGSDAPLCHLATRRRIRTVMQELMYQTGRRLKLALGKHCPAVPIFKRLSERLAYG